MTNEEATIDTTEAQERVQAILKPNGVITTGAFSAQAPAQPPAPTRRTRSDKGIPKGPKKPVEPLRNGLTVAQMEELTELIEASHKADLDAISAQAKSLNAAADLHQYLESLTIDSQNRTR